jgi:hypothetical protein
MAKKCERVQMTIDPKRGAGISLLIPFRDDNAVGRGANWRWLQQFWEAELPSAQIVVGITDAIPFSKTRAVNDAFQRSDTENDIVVILDADCYIEPSVILTCAAAIREARRWNERLWYIPYRWLYRLTETSTARLIASDPANAVQFPTPPVGTDVGSTLGAAIGHRFGALIQIMPREAFTVIGGMDPRFCVDEETQILTQQGWRFHHELRVKDVVLTLNHDTGLSEWQPVKHINVFYGQHEMLSIESKTHSSLTTLNHKWPTIRRPDYRAKTGWGSPKETRWWTTSDSITHECYVPMAAEHAELPLVKTHIDAFVECVAWFWTEGHIDRLRNGTHGRSATISQSFVVNREKCERIRLALTGAFGQSSSFPRRGASNDADIPRWRERIDRRNISFILNAEAGALMQGFAPNRVPSCAFLLSLTKQQLDLFIECSILGDGNRRKRGYEIGLRQKDKAAVDAFQFACILAGHCTSVSTEKIRVFYGYGMTFLRIRQQKRFKLCKGTHTRVTLEGVVWCPTTKNKTWLARRNGKTYFTGNSGWGGEDVTTLRALDTLYGVHETTKNEVLTLWHTAIGDVFLRKWAGQPDIGANNLLSVRYRKTRRDPGRMRDIVREWLDEPAYAAHRISPLPPWYHDKEKHEV